MDFVIEIIVRGVGRFDFRNRIEKTLRNDSLIRYRFEAMDRNELAAPPNERCLGRRKRFR